MSELGVVGNLLGESSVSDTSPLTELRVSRVTPSPNLERARLRPVGLFGVAGTVFCCDMTAPPSEPRRCPVGNGVIGGRGLEAGVENADGR